MQIDKCKSQLKSQLASELWGQLEHQLGKYLILKLHGQCWIQLRNQFVGHMQIKLKDLIYTGAWANE